MHSSSPALLFGSTEFFLRFKADIEAYCRSQEYDLALTDAEIEHLLWNVGNEYQSPEACKNINPAFPHLPFEIKRSLARCYSFQLILAGDVFSYRQFIQAQPEHDKLSFEDFKSLTVQAQKLTPEMQAVVRATSFLVGSKTLRERCHACLNDETKFALANRQMPQTISNDGEELLSQFAVLAALTPDLTPITQAFTAEQRALLIKAFWPNLHMRWLYSTEGANNMTQTLVRGIETGQFNQQTDLSIWAWRWRLNVAGFQGGPAAKFYDSKSHHLIELMLTELNHLFVDIRYPFLSKYLMSNCEAAGIPTDIFAPAELAFLGHLITYLAYFHRADIFVEENAKALVSAYQEFKASFPDQSPIDAYDAACNNRNAITPTYVPGVMDTAFGLLKQYLDTNIMPTKLDMTTCFQAHPENIAPAIHLTVKFMCQLSAALYSQDLSERVSCMMLAKPEILTVKLQQWIQDHHSIQFNLTHGKDGMELQSTLASPQPSLSLN